MTGGGLLLDPCGGRVDPATLLGGHSDLVAVAGESHWRRWESARWRVLAHPVRARFTGERRRWCLRQIYYIVFLVSWHGWLILHLPFWFLMDGLEHCCAAAPGPFLAQGIDIQNMDF